MEIRAGFNRLWAAWTAPCGSFPYLPPEMQARVLDSFDGTPRQYLDVMHASRSWRAAALAPVTLGNYLARQQHPASVHDMHAQQRALRNLVVVPRNIRCSRFHVAQIDGDTLERARSMALKAPLQPAPAMPGTMCVRYSPNGVWFVSVLDGHDGTLVVGSLREPIGGNMYISPIPMAFPPDGAAISNDGNTAFVHSGQQDYVFRLTDAHRGKDAQRLTLFDGDETQWRTFAMGGNSVSCSMSPSGRWLVIDLGSRAELQLWDLTGSTPQCTTLTHAEFAPLKTTLFFGSDESCLYFSTLSDESFCVNFDM